MEMVIAMAALAMIGGIVTAVSKFVSRKRNSRAMPVLPTPIFKVVALGNSGSGKTVLLASLFYQFRIRPGRPYYFDTDAETRVRLGNFLAAVVDPGRPWPGATDRTTTRTYVFDCVAQIAQEPTTAFKIEYVDYAGEIFDVIGESSSSLLDIEARVKSADALIGMLDGRRVLQFLRGEASGRSYLIGEIATIVRSIAQARCPVYLVISKWDLLHGFGEPDNADDRTRLSLVSRALMSVDQVRDLIATRTKVRLIPVSAVGPGFAVLDTSDGVVRKLPDGTFSPYNVELPIAAIVPDLFIRIRERIREETIGAIQSEYRTRQRYSPDEMVSRAGAFLLEPAGIALRASIDGLLSRPYSNDLLVMMLDWIGGPSRKRESELAAFRDQMRRQTYLLADARMAVLDDFHKQVRQLESDLPASVLSR